MKKRLISILLTLCMVLCLMPTAVLAADEVSAKVNGIAVPAAGGSITGEGISGSVVFDASAKTLTLENATISVTTEEKAIDIRSGIDTLILKGKNEIKWADESDKKTSICAISASSSSFLIKGNSREDSLTVTLPGTTGGYKYAYAISMGKCEIRNCSLDITVIGGMQNAGDNVAIRASDLKIKNAALNLIVGKDRQENVQKAMQGGCVYATGRISIENSYINAGIYSSLDAHLANFYAVLQGQGGTTCTDSVIYAEADVLKVGRTICLDGVDTTFSVKNSIFKAKSNQYAFSGYKYAKPTFESSLVELESKDIVMRGPTFGTISGFTKITATDKNGGDTTYKPGDDLSTLSTDSRKVVIESQIHSHCVCGGENAAEGHTVHSPLMWTPWTKTDSLPTAAGNYYLTGNVLLKSNSDYFMPDGVQICLNGYVIRGVGGTNKPTLYANGGTLTVTDCGTRGAIGDIKMSSGELLVYGGKFVRELIIGETGGFTAADRVGIGAEVTNKGFIFGGIFDGAVINDGGTIKGGTFNGRVNLKRGNVIGGIYYGRVTYGGAVIHDSACRYLTFDTDGGSAMDAQRVLRGQKATLPTENPVKTGYIFSGWTGFDYTKPMLENAGATAIWTVCDHSGNTTQLSCTEPVACSVCGGTIVALGHDFSASVWHHDGDTHWKKCARCDAKNDENPHVWDNGKVTVPSTCLTEGERIYTCDECGATKNEPIQANGHSWDQAWQHNATHHWHECLNANCDVKNNDSAKDGYGAHTGGTATCTQRATCTVCGAEYGDALGHDFTTSWTHDDNEHWKQCSRCDAKDDVSPHTWDSGTITTAPTCTKAGKKTYSCTKCDATKIEPIPATGHSWKSDWTSDATHHWHECANENCDVTDNAGKKGYAEHSGGKATCTQKANCTVCGVEYGNALGHDFTVRQYDNDNHWMKCSRCDEIENKSSHTWDSGTVTTAPTCTKGGKKTYTCTVCHATKTESINATGHNWKSDWTSDATHHWHECANENCDVTDNAGKDGYAEHSGGTATCTEKAVCTHCGQSYGETNPVNHTGTEQWTQTTTTHEKKWNCCNTVSVPNENHEWADGVCSECGYVCLHEDTDKNHICDICGKTISDHKDADNNHLCDYCGEKISNHSGGTATCKDKAKCEICGESYGELNVNNHSDLKHFPAMAATKTAEGNIEYWYCSGCKKYYKDAKATQEITKAQTVTAKLQSDNNDSNNKPGNNATTSPQTGDNSNLALWIALLFISGGAVTATTVYGRKKKRSVK